MPANTILVSIIIPVWNRWDLTQACLHSLHASTPGSYFEVIVADNHSSDETSTDLIPLGQSLFGDRFTCLRFDSNTGFGPACNAGAKAAKGNHLLFLNNDTILTDNWLPPLMKAMSSDDRLGAVGPLLLYPETNRVQHCGIAITPSLHIEHLYANFPATHPAVHAKRSLQAITGAVILIEKNFFFSCGAFYAGYRNGSEDLELCCRIREAGKRVSVVTQSVVYHLESQTPGRGDQDSENANLFNERCNGCFGPDLHKFARKDGYTLAITPWLEFYITLPSKREEEITLLMSRKFNPSECWNMLQKEPLWHTGYNLIATMLEEKEQYVEASGIRLLQTYFFPMLPYYKQLATTATMAGNITLAKQAVDKAEHVNKLLEDPGPLIKKAAGLANWAQKAGEPEIKQLCEDWLRDLGLL